MNISVETIESFIKYVPKNGSLRVEFHLPKSSVALQMDKDGYTVTRHKYGTRKVLK